eukprot:gnl/Spiro4/26266_TR13099_c0_g2_i1.p1 gnl/Spiro4/26266_TR13099_c0_g2~~gnl/Spiro4/26266_TR13099_c0_g2_i1.p1  ORF type:complete len:864 (-),score=204.45 gnl/Spiro4/26266_TR13099_c0_g2_i1:20-2275(-)
MDKDFVKDSDTGVLPCRSAWHRVAASCDEPLVDSLRRIWRVKPESLPTAKCGGGTKYIVVFQLSNKKSDSFLSEAPTKVLKWFSSSTQGGFPDENIFAVAYKIGKDNDYLDLVDRFGSIDQKKMSWRNLVRVLTGDYKAQQVKRVMYSTELDDIVLVFSIHGSYMNAVMDSRILMMTATDFISTTLISRDQFQKLVNSMRFKNMLLYMGNCYAMSFFVRDGSPEEVTGFKTRLFPWQNVYVMTASPLLQQSSGDHFESSAVREVAVAGPIGVCHFERPPLNKRTVNDHFLCVRDMVQVQESAVARNLELVRSRAPRIFALEKMRRCLNPLINSKPVVKEKEKEESVEDVVMEEDIEKGTGVMTKNAKLLVETELNEKDKIATRLDVDQSESDAWLKYLEGLDEPKTTTTPILDLSESDEWVTYFKELFTPDESEETSPSESGSDGGKAAEKETLDDDAKVAKVVQAISKQLKTNGIPMTVSDKATQPQQNLEARALYMAWLFLTSNLFCPGATEVLGKFRYILSKTEILETCLVELLVDDTRFISENCHKPFAVVARSVVAHRDKETIAESLGVEATEDPVAKWMQDAWAFLADQMVESWGSQTGAPDEEDREVLSFDDEQVWDAPILAERLLRKLNKVIDEFAPAFTMAKSALDKFGAELESRDSQTYERMLERGKFSKKQQFQVMYDFYTGAKNPRGFMHNALALTKYWVNEIHTDRSLQGFCAAEAEADSAQCVPWESRLIADFWKWG